MLKGLTCLFPQYHYVLYQKHLENVQDYRPSDVCACFLVFAEGLVIQIGPKIAQDVLCHSEFDTDLTLQGVHLQCL